MASPQTEDGWLKYAHELDAALAVADFTKGARIVLREVFSQIFGPAKLKTAKVSPTELASRVGKMREQIARAVKELVDANVLKRLQNGRYRFNKDYESWRSKDGPRLTQAEIAWCAEEAEHARKFRADASTNDRNNLVTTHQQETVTVQSTDQPNGVTELLRDRNNLVTENVTELLRADEPPHTPHRRNAGAVLRIGEFETTTEDEVARIESWAKTTFKANDVYELQNIGPNIGQWIRSGLKADWVPEALLAGAANDPRYIVRYANGCLRKWGKRGKSTSEEAAEKEAQSKATASPSGTKSSVVLTPEMLELGRRMARKDAK